MVTRSFTYQYKDLRSNTDATRNVNGNVIIELEDEFDGGLLEKKHTDKEIITLQPPPPWLKTHLDYLNNQFSEIRANLNTLVKMHKERPSFSEATNHTEIEDFTTVLTARFMRVSDAIKATGTNVRLESDSQQRLVKNIKSRLAGRLQNLSEEYETSQQNYLANVMGRSKAVSLFNQLDSDSDDDTVFSPDGSDEPQQMMLKEDMRAAKTRDKQVRQLAKSITDITTLFKSMAEMVATQGTMLDRIDNNISSARSNVDHAVQQLGETDTLTSTNGKCLLIFLAIILGFSATVLVLIRLRMD